MSPPRQIAVLGGGIAGIAAGLALAKAGAKVRIFEQSAEITEVGAGLQISPNGARVLQSLGLGDALEEAGTRTEAVELTDGKSGSVVARLALKDRDYYLLHRADLITMLANAAWAADIRIELGRKATSVVPDDSGVSLTFADGSHEEVPFLIAADGVHSVARPALGDTPDPVFSGQAAWRAVIRPDHPPEPVVRVHMGEGRHLVEYPLADGRLINIVAVEERPDWTADGWNALDEPARLRAAYRDFDLPVRDLLSKVEQVHIWGLHLYPVLPCWRRGPLCVAGDAAHPTLPFLAQGANMALEDAWALGWHLSQGSDVDAALAAYEAERKPRTTKVVAAARSNARNYHLRGLSRLLGHGALRVGQAVAPGLVTRQFDWIYDHDVTARSGV